MLLTGPTSLSTAAKSAIVDLTIKQVIVMGGTLAITNSVVSSLESMGIEVIRVAGHTYNDTATELAKFEAKALSMDTAHTVAVARGTGFTDGLVGAVVAGSGTAPYPLVLTTSPTAVGSYLTAFLKASGKTTSGIAGTGDTITTLKIFGGTLAVTPAAVSQMESDIGE